MRFPLSYPPGVFRNGTDWQSGGRFVDTNLIRWYGKAIGPIGGWHTRGSGAVTGAARAILPWKDSGSLTWIAVGTHSKLYVSKRDGSLFDITPVGFTTGRVDATSSGGFGSGLFGAGLFGTPRPDTTAIQDATQWTFDLFGQYLVGISPDDGKLNKWTLNTASKAAQISGSPTGKAVVVTQEGFIFVLASTDSRTISWCDQRDDSVWTPDATNQAGDIALQTAGRIICGKAVDGQTLIFTDQDVWAATYEATNDVYGFSRRGDACGAASRQCVATFNMQAAWVAPNFTFWRYNGFVQPIECEVLDYVKSDYNPLQISKIFAHHISEHSEIEWHYCSANSNEIDRCVVWNYKGVEGSAPFWILGRPSRFCGADKRAGFVYPVMVDSAGLIYDHEVGAYLGGDTAYAEAGQLTMGNGDNIMWVMGLYPDDLTVGDVTATLSTKNNRDDAYTVNGPYTLDSQTDLRITGRQVKVRFDGVTMNPWRVGTPALELVKGEGR